MRSLEDDAINIAKPGVLSEHAWRFVGKKEEKIGKGPWLGMQIVEETADDLGT